MQTFINSDGSQWAFEDDVVVSVNEDGTRTFTAPHGAVLNVPALLTPHIPVPPTDAELLANAKTDRQAFIRAECAMAITSGFTSSAIGESRAYPSDALSQTNIRDLALIGGSIWCSADAGATWDFITHSAEQAAQVLNDMIAARQALQSRYAAKLTEIESATTIDGVNAVVWPAS